MALGDKAILIEQRSMTITKEQLANFITLNYGANSPPDGSSGTSRHRRRRRPRRPRDSPWRSGRPHRTSCTQSPPSCSRSVDWFLIIISTWAVRERMLEILKLHLLTAPLVASPASGSTPPVCNQLWKDGRRPSQSQCIDGWMDNNLSSA